MAGWDRYRLDVLDAVLAELGARTRRPGGEGGPWVWLIEREGHLHLASYKQGADGEGIAADDVDRFARNLGFDPAEVFRLLDAKGGRILDL